MLVTLTTCQFRTHQRLTSRQSVKPSTADKISNFRPSSGTFPGDIPPPEFDQDVFGTTQESMDVDPSPGSSIDTTSVPLPKIDEVHVMENKTPKQRALELLDILEGHVEKLRREAVKLEEDRDALLASLDSVRNADIVSDLIEYEREDIFRYVDRVTSRCLTVEVRVVTQRDKMQEEALHQVNSLIDGLVTGIRTDPDGSRARCVSYMNACAAHVVQGVTDKNFESALLGCTLDDQKRVKKRLAGLLNYFDRLNVTSLT